MVNKTLLIIKSNIVKSRRQLVSVIALIILSSLLLNLALVLKSDYNQTLTRDLDKLNANDFRIVCTNLSGVDYEETISDCLADDPRIKDFEIDEVFIGDGDAEFSDGSVSSMIVLEKYSDTRNDKIDRYEIIEDDKKITDGAYVSYWFKTSGKKTGDYCKFTIGNDSFVFQIKGFYNCPVIGTVSSGGIAYILSDKLYEDTIIDKPTSYLVKIRCRDKNEDVNVYKDTVEAIDSLNLNGSISHTAFSKDNKTTRYTNSDFCQMTLVISSIMMTVILLLIIAIIMSNYVRNNIKDFGILKAIGYTSTTLIIPLMIEVGVLCFIFSMIGIGGSYALLPIINNAMEAQSGIPYQIRFLFIPCLMTLVICELTTLASTFISVMKIRKISSINAIRTAKETSGRLPDKLNFDKIGLNINQAIGLNTALKFISHSVITFFTFVGVAFLLCFSLFIYQNFIADNTDVLKVICGEVPNYIVSVDKKNESDLVDYLDDNQMVSDYYLYNIGDKTPIEKPTVSLIGVDKDSNVSKLAYLVVDGKFPDNDNEIAVNKIYAIRNDIHLNDEMRFVYEDEQFSFKVVGFTQGATRAGTEGYILKEGLEYISDPYSLSYYVFLKNVNDEETFKTDIMDNCPILSLLNNRQTVSSMASGYIMILVVLTIVLCIISTCIVCFILYVLLSLLLNNKRREHGILKALGFTTKDIIIQTETSILPLSILGSAVGLIFSRKLAGNLFSFALNSIGIFDFGKPVSFVSLGILLIALSILVAGLVALLCIPITKISTHELFNRE